MRRIIAVIALAASTLHGPVLAAGWLSDNFDSYSIGNLVGQGSWTGVAGPVYIESEDRTSGIRVQKSNHGVSVGQRVDVTGAMATNSDGERYISATSITQNGFGM